MTEIRVQIGDKVWDKGEVHKLLDRSPQAVARALLVVYENQTADEQATEMTKHRNGVGFTGNDANWLTDIAKKWNRYQRWASDRQLNAVRRAVKKYHRQILERMAEQPGAVRLEGKQKARSQAEVYEQQEVQEAEGTW